MDPRKVARCGVAVALLAVSACVALPLGPVPFTLQTLVIAMLPVALGGRDALVAMACYLAFGALGLPVIYMLWQNISNLGLIGGLMADHGRLDLFFGMILPHGLLELTAVFVAAGAGLRMFWSWVEPGHRSRASNFAREARSTMTLALGLIVVLFVTGLIEGFVTPSGLPTWARIAVGVIAELLFFVYVWTLGRDAARRGVTGDLTGVDATAEAPSRG